MNLEPLNHKNYFLYCAKYYDNPQCVDIEEFKEDLNRIKYIKKLITRYEQKGELREHLILNHIITLYNVFGPSHLPRILYLKMNKQISCITPFLILLNCMPDVLYNVDDEEVIHTDEWPIDMNIVRELRKKIAPGLLQ